VVGGLLPPLVGCAVLVLEHARVDLVADEEDPDYDKEEGDGEEEEWASSLGAVPAWISRCGVGTEKTHDGW
jgi:hypothetical protein